MRPATPKLTFRRKLTLITMIASGGALLLAGIAFTIFEVVVFRDTMLEQVRRTARIVGDNSAAALSFADPNSAEQTLSSIAGDPHIRAAVLYDENGGVFARYRSIAEPGIVLPPTPGTGHSFGDGTLTFFQPVILRGEHIGTLCLVSDTREMSERLWRYLLIALLVLAASSGCAWLFSRRLHRAITDPITELSVVAGAVAAEKNYSLRARKSADDEIGRLIEGFNEMLAQIQARDAELKAARELLEARVVARTEELSMALRQLEDTVQARARDEEARRTLERNLEHAQRLESLGVLAGGIAHDFNNLLTGVLGRASLARLSNPSPEIAEHLKQIELCARRAAELCEQMLAYAGQGRVSVIEVDLNELIREMRDLVHTSVPRDAAFVLTLAPAPTIVRGDPARLRQVVMNLVINAAEALGPGSREVRLVSELRTVAASELAGMTFCGEAVAGSFVVVKVSDTGSGMAPETIARIFEPFYTTKFDGRGLGLSAALGIVRSHGGALNVRSVLGRGSTFEVYLPLAAALVARSQASSPPAPLPRAGARLLVVDDEECVRTVTAQALRRGGYEIEVACDGQEAVDLMRARPEAFDAVVLDVTMPRMNGIAALQAMREIRPRLPAVLISGYGQQTTLAHFADRSDTAALQKPFDIDSLLTTLARVLTDASKSVSSGLNGA